MALSKHLQTRQYLNTLQSYLSEIQCVLIHLYLSANERPVPFVDHSGILHDSKTGQAINGQTSESWLLSKIQQHYHINCISIPCHEQSKNPESLCMLHDSMAHCVAMRMVWFL
ncbi:hypothetical protein J3R83DRAFT_11665 [Lanmaoa asiatica]|nr:hypothetical protein J3R83DRAFT_11665 [Lanmaoa asiatica]